jgi:hypothetical protein
MAYNEKMEMAKTKEYGEMVKYLTGMLDDDYDEKEEMEMEPEMDMEVEEVEEDERDASDEREDFMADMSDDERKAYIKKYLGA